MPFRPIARGAAASAPPSHAALPVTPVQPPARIRPSPPVQEPPSRPARKHHVVDRSGPNWDENGDYIVGKNRPPKATRWPEGQSGNPTGPKPREKVDPETELDNAILAEFGTLANGEVVQTNLGLFAINVLKAKAAQKDRQSAIFLLDLYLQKLRARSAQVEGTGIPPEEQAIIDSLLDAAGWTTLPPIRSLRRDADEPETDHE